MRGAITTLVIAAAVTATSQAPQHRVETATMSRRVDWGRFSAKIFSDADRRMVFTLATSWIPGEKHQGMLRYIIAAWPEKPTEQAADNDASPAAPSPAAKSTDSPESDEKLITRAHDCSFTLNLDDVDGFVLRKIVVPFGYGVDPDDKLTSLFANDSEQMDVAEYRLFLGSSKKSGSWSVSWDCPSVTPK